MRAKPLTTKVVFWATVAGLSMMATTSAYAAGFALIEQGAGAYGVAGAATARADLSESGFFNPASWAFHRGLQLGIGGSAIKASIAHQNPGTLAHTQAITQLGTPPYIYAAYEWNGFIAGIAGRVPFGSGLGWPEDWEGRFEITEIALRAYELAPVIGWRPIEQIAIAAGPRIKAASVVYQRKIDTVHPEHEGHVLLGGTSTSFGAQFSVLYQALPELSFGLSWRSRARFDFDGAAQFQNVPIELSGKAHDTRASTTLTTPARTALGAAYDFGFGIVSFDTEYVTWSDFKEFAIKFESEDVADVAEPRNWHNTLTFRLGYEHRDIWQNLSARAGFAYDPTPSPTDTLSPSMPDGDRYVFTLGLGYRFENGISVDMAYGHTQIDNKVPTGDTFPGLYSASANALSLGVSYR